jgi:hypothetical protein
MHTGISVIPICILGLRSLPVCIWEVLKGPSLYAYGDPHMRMGIAIHILGSPYAYGQR